MIYIAAHKAFDVLPLEGYQPIQVGAAGKESLGYLRDDSGDHISHKNPNFCELTGLYWIWKNSREPYKGLVHYRRYFGRSNFASGYNAIYSYGQMVDFLREADIVLPYVERFKQNARDEILVSCCTGEIFEALRETVRKIYPEYLPDFDGFFSQNQCTLFNMMFCQSGLFDRYCQWLFDILFELEKSVDLSGLNAYQQRLYGFLSERLLNVWVRHNHLKCKNLPVVQLEMPVRQKLTLLRRRITNQIFFTLSHRH